MISHILFRSSICAPLIAWLGIAFVAFWGGWFSKGCYSPVLGEDPFVDRAVERLETEVEGYEDSAEELRNAGESRLGNLATIPSVPEIPEYAYKAAGSDEVADSSTATGAPSGGISNESFVIPENLDDSTYDDRALSEGGREIVSSINGAIARRLQVAEYRVRELSAIVVQQQKVIQAHERRENQYKLTVRNLQDSIKQYTRALGAERRKAEVLEERVDALEKSSKGNSLFSIGVFGVMNPMNADMQWGVGVGLNLNPIVGAIVG